MSVSDLIREEVEREVRREAARRVVSRALNEHRRTILHGGSVLQANEAFLDRLSEGAEEGGIRASIRAVLQSAIKRVASSHVDKLMTSLGLDGAPKLRRVIRGIILNALAEIIDEGDLMNMSCKRVGDTLARSTLKTLPEAIYDAITGTTGQLRSEEQVGAIPGVVREAILNFFARSDVAEEITQRFTDLVCSVSLTDIVASAAGDAGRAAMSMAGLSEGATDARGEGP